MRVSFIAILLVSVQLFAQNSEPVYFGNQSDDVSSIAYSPDNKFLVSGSWDGSLLIYSNDSSYSFFESGKEYDVVQTIQQDQGAINSIAFSRDGFKLIAGGQDGLVKIYGFNDSSSWDIAGLDTTLDINKGSITKLIYGPGMRTIFSAGEDGNFVTFDIAKNKVIPLETKKPISAAAVAVDRMSFFIANEYSPTITQYSIFGKVLNTFEGHSNDITDLITTVDRKYLISSSKDKTIKIWTIANGKEFKTLSGHTWEVKDIDLDVSGKFLVSCGLDGKVILWDVTAGEPLMVQELPDAKCNAISLSPNLTQIAVATHLDNSSGPSGFYIINTPLKERKVSVAKRVIIEKKPEVAKTKTTSKSTSANNNSKASTSTKAKPNEKVIKKTDQLEIRREN